MHARFRHRHVGPPHPRTACEVGYRDRYRDGTASYGMRAARLRDCGAGTPLSTYSMPGRHPAQIALLLLPTACPHRHVHTVERLS
eukprot:scaffold13849_cov136-Isochrysis_galbana.AAC.2